MSNLFSQVLNMSITGSVVILLVMLARLILKRAPKIFSYALWSVVLFRLLCPVAFTAPISVLDVVEPEIKEASKNTSIVSYIPANVDTQTDFVMVQPQSQTVNQAEVSEPEEQLRMTPMHTAAVVWAVGAVGMLFYSMGQYLRLRKKLIGAVLLNRNIYVADHIDTAFVVGLAKPKIYLPSNVPAKERFYIIAHEQHHIRRYDHIIKLLAYLALCIHWFNPLVWFAFALAGKDMEMSCDEAVIKRLGIQIRADYSTTLLRLTTHIKILPGMPLAFGEGDTKGRILNMAKWKKPRLWVSVLCMVMCVAILAACVVNPVLEEKTTDERDPVAAFSGESINVLFTLVSDEEGSSAPKSILVSVDPTLRMVTMGTFLGDAYVSVPDYQGHHIGKNKFSVCYTLGKSWGGIEGAEEMLNQCIQDNFGITVDHNIEFIDPEFTRFMAVLDEIVGKLDAPLLPELQDISDQFLSIIAGSEDPKKILAVKEQLKAAKWEGCTIPSEGTYIGEEVEIDGIKTYVLSMEEPQDSIGSTEKAVAISGTDIITDTEMVQYGALKMLLSSGFAATEAQGVVVLTKDSVAVGGIRHWNYPEFQPSDIVELKQEESGAPIGYMSGSSAYGDTEYEIFWDGNPAGLCEQHTFFIDGNIIYDVWYDENQISDGIAERFLKTVAINADPNPPITPQEQEALAKCKSVLDTVQGGSHHISREESRTNSSGTSGYRVEYFSYDEDWMYVTYINVGNDKIETQYRMKVNGQKCYNVESPVNDNIMWGEEDIVEQRRPWLSSYQWNDSTVAYVDTLHDQGLETIMLRIDEPFYGYPEETQSYFVNFLFDASGSFLKAELEAIVFRNNELWTANETETICSLDSEAVNAEIQKEYQKAIG